MGYISNFTITLLVNPTAPGGDAYDDIKIRAQAAQRIVGGEDIETVTEWARHNLMYLREPLKSLQNMLTKDLGADPYPNDDGLYVGSCMWYKMSADMARISISFPGAVIQVDRYGEEDGDIERTWFADGKATPSVKPVMMWPEFDCAMLGAEEK